MFELRGVAGNTLGLPESCFLALIFPDDILPAPMEVDMWHWDENIKSREMPWRSPHYD